MQSFSKFLSLIYLCHVALIVSLLSFLMHFVGYPYFLAFALKWILFSKQQQVLARFVFHVLGGTACYRIYNIQYQYDLVVLWCTGQFIYLYIPHTSILLSINPQKICVTSREFATEYTTPKCPLNALKHCPICKLHTLILPLLDLEMVLHPSPFIAMEHSSSICS